MKYFILILLDYSITIDNPNDQAQLQILDEVNLQVVEQEQAIRQLEVGIKSFISVTMIDYVKYGTYLFRPTFVM